LIIGEKDHGSVQDKHTPPRSDSRAPGSGRLRFAATGALIWERLWPLLVPAFLVLCALALFSWMGGWRFVDAYENQNVFWFSRIAAALALVGALLPLKNLAWPNLDEVNRRIELKSGLEHRPLTAQQDRMATGAKDDFSAILWHTHRERMAAHLENMSAGTPSPRAERYDPFAFRAVLPILAFAAFFFSFSPTGGSIRDIFRENVAIASLPSRMDAWVEPPAYTRKPPIYLSLSANSGPQPNVIRVPAGSEFFLRFIGRPDVALTVDNGGVPVEVVQENIDEAAQARAASGDDATTSEYVLRLNTDSVVSLSAGEETLGQWALSVIPDRAPSIAFSQAPNRALSGSLQLAYEVADDYGVVGARADIQSLEKRDANAVPLYEAPRIDLSLPRQRARSGSARVNRDVTQHPWAGSRVSIRLIAEDDLGQTGLSKIEELELPGRSFSNPLALAMLEQRRILALDARKQDRVADLLDAVSTAPAKYIGNTNAMMSMRVAHRRLRDANNHDDLRSVVELLWEIALGIEFGDLSDAERRLREAQEQLSNALENGASDEEIERLMDELRQAMNELLQSLAEQARQNPQGDNPFEQDNNRTLSQNDLERMMDRIENLARSGSKDVARQLLSEMQRMMDNLRAGRHQQQRQAEGNQMNQALDQMSELMRRQQELMDETFQMQRRQQQGQQGDQQQGQQGQRGQQGQQFGQQGQQFGQQGQQGQRDQNGQQGQGQQGQSQQGQSQGQQPGQGNGGQMSQEQLAKALRQLQQQQQQLQQELSQLGQQLEGLGLGQSQELQDAQREMGEAGDNLGEGNPGGAATDQGQALEALRQGAQQMMQQMAGDRQQGGQQQARGQGQNGQQRGRDPLGRDTGSDGMNLDSNVEVPGEIDAQRARRILEAIRKRLAIPDNPIIEQDYLERLLRTE